MHPILFKLGPVTLYTYGAFLALGAGCALWLLGRLSRSAGLNPERVQSLALGVLVAGLIGSRLGFVLIEWPAFARHPWRIFSFWDGGLVFYGGIIGGLLVGWWLARRWAIPLLPLLDCFAPALALGQMFGRLGCFSAGCCYGLPWEHGACAVTFTDPHSLAPRGVPLHPTQLYSSGSQALILAFLLWLWPRRRYSGKIFFSYAMLHGVARVVIEQFRADWRGAPLFWGLTPTAVFALGLALMGAVGLWFTSRRRTKGD